MLTKNPSLSMAAWTALATGVVGLLGLTFLTLFFAIGGPFGAFNDICNGLGAVLSAILAWRLYPRLQAQLPLLSRVTLALAILGAMLAVVGTYLVLSNMYGWYLPGLYTAAGYGMIGLWLLGLTYRGLKDHSLPRGLAIFGLITAVILALGLAAIPGIFRGIDSNTYEFTAFNAVWWTSSLGYLTIYPILCILFGRLLLSGREGE